MIQQVQKLATEHPVVNWLAIAGSMVLSVLQPLAALAAFVLACLQIYGWFEKRAEKKRKDNADLS